MTNIKTMMEEMAQEELERDGAACREVMQSRKKNADGDLISRKALIAEYDRVHVGAPGGARKLMVEAPTVDAVPLPCKLGDTVWAIRNFRGVKHAACGKVGEMFYTQDMRLMIVVHFVARGEWGKTVFATQEEAEAAIDAARMDGDET